MLVSSEVMDNDATRAKKAAYMRDWYWRNHEKAKAQRRKSSAKNVAKIVIYINEWRNKDREKFNAQRRDHYQRNGARIREWQKKYRVGKPSRYANPDYKAKRLVYEREYMKRRMKTDINFRIKERLKARIRKVLKSAKTRKPMATMKLVGCDIKFLKGFLEARFKEGMSWENYGKWHIDHVIPLAEFDLTKPEQQRQAFNYTNLQPLWGPDNIRKKAKVPKTHQPEFL